MYDLRVMLSLALRKVPLRVSKYLLSIFQYISLKKLREYYFIDEYGCKTTRPKNGYLEISKFWGFNPKNLEKLIFFKTFTNPICLRNLKKRIYVIEPHVYYLHAKFEGNPSIFNTPIVQKP